MARNISIAKADDLIYIGNDVNIYLVFYPGQLSFGKTVLTGQKRPLFMTIFLSISCKLIQELTHNRQAFNSR